MTIARLRKRSGLTFLEVLLALSMLGFLMIAGTSMLYSFTKTYFTLETGPLFERHVDGVNEFLHYLATFPDDPNAAPGRQFGWKVSPVSKKASLCFTVNRDIPFFVTEFKPVPKVTCYLEFDDENKQFWLLWYVDPALTNGTPQYRYTLLSEWASDIEYGYYDASQKSWEFELASSDNRQKGKTRPNRVRIIFEREGTEISRTLDFRALNSHVLVY